MSDATKDEEGIHVNVLTPDAIAVILKLTSDAAHNEGEARAFGHVLTLLSDLKHTSEDELSRNEHSAIALAQVMLITNIINALAPLPKMYQGRANTYIDQLKAVFEVIGFEMEDEDEATA